MLQAGVTFTLFINICTFLYAGNLLHRSRLSNVNQLIDTTPTPNWILLGSKFLAIVKMQMILISLAMISGILFQIYNGYYDFEIGHYLFELIGLTLVSYIIWALLSFLIQTLITDRYVGLFIMIVLFIGIPLLGAAGVEQSIFKYNAGTGYSYSDMNGYGSSLNRFFLYKIYWLSLGLVFYILTSLFYFRGLPSSFKERIVIEPGVEYIFGQWQRAKRNLYLTMIPIANLEKTPTQRRVSKLPISVKKGVPGSKLTPYQVRAIRAF